MGSTLVSGPAVSILPSTRHPVVMVVAVHNLSSVHFDRVVHFHIIDLDGSFFLWIGDTSLSFEDLQVACPTRYDTMSPVTTLCGELDGPGTTLAQMLSKRFKVPVFLSYNLGADGDLMIWAQKEAIRHLGAVLVAADDGEKR